MFGAPCYSYDGLVLALLWFSRVVLNFLLIASPGHGPSNTPPYCIRHYLFLENLLGVMSMLIAHAQGICIKAYGQLRIVLQCAAGCLLTNHSFQKMDTYHYPEA